MSTVLLGYISFGFSAIGIILNAKKNILCWPIWLASNVGWIIYSVLTNSIPTLILWIFYSIFNVYGWKKWHNDQKQNIRKPLPDDETIYDNYLILKKELDNEKNNFKLDANSFLIACNWLKDYMKGNN